MERVFIKVLGSGKPGVVGVILDIAPTAMSVSPALKQYCAQLCQYVEERGPDYPFDPPNAATDLLLEKLDEAWSHLTTDEAAFLEQDFRAPVLRILQERGQRALMEATDPECFAPGAVWFPEVIK